MGEHKNWSPQQKLFEQIPRPYPMRLPAAGDARAQMDYDVNLALLEAELDMKSSAIGRGNVGYDAIKRMFRR